MTRFSRASLLMAAACLATQALAAGSGEVVFAAHPASFGEHQAQCAGKEGWSDAAPPVRIFGNVYDVGTCGIVVLLVAGEKGHILIDAATAEAAPSIIANIRRLGFRPTDVKLLLSSHEHVDHAGGLSALQRLTGARLLATAAARPALESGAASADDPQKGSLPDFTGIHVGRILQDGEVVALGSLRLTAHTTPGHAPGSTSWSWTSCEGKVCHAVVYADSLSAVSADRYRFSDHPAYVSAFRASIARIARLPCDLIITPHPAASDLYGRLAGATRLSDPAACVAYAAASSFKLDQRLAKERAKPVRRRGSNSSRR